MTGGHRRAPAELFRRSAVVTGKRLLTALVVAVAMAAGAPVGASEPRAAAAPGPNPVLRWNGALLDTIRSTRTPPTIGARPLAATDTPLSDAWASHAPGAAPPPPHRPPPPPTHDPPPAPTKPPTHP